MSKKMYEGEPPDQERKKGKRGRKLCGRRSKTTTQNLKS